MAPGVYNAELRFVQDTPYAVPNLPVKMTASIPPTMGKLAGTVSTDGYCDMNPAVLANVPVTVKVTAAAIAAASFGLWSTVLLP